MYSYMFYSTTILMWRILTPNVFSQLYFLSGLRNDTLLEYTSVKSFTEGSSRHSPKEVKLPSYWQGTGHMVYKGFLFYHKADTTNQIVKVSDIQYINRDLNRKRD